jgi:hypothetical protein
MVTEADPDGGAASPIGRSKLNFSQVLSPLRAHLAERGWELRFAGLFGIFPKRYFSGSVAVNLIWWGKPFFDCAAAFLAG